MCRMRRQTGRTRRRLARPHTTADDRLGSPPGRLSFGRRGQSDGRDGNAGRRRYAPPRGAARRQTGGADGSPRVAGVIGREGEGGRLTGARARGAGPRPA